MKKLMLKFTILLSGTAYVISTAVFVVLLANLAKVYVGASAASIGMIISLPAGLMVPAVYISGKLSSVISKKTILIIGYVIFTISGLGGLLASNITILLVMRAFTGIAIGLIMPMPRALIAQFYEGTERASMVGLLSSVNGLISMCLSVIVGYLIVINWQLPYYVFLLGPIIIAMIMVFIPKVPAEKIVKSDVAEKLPSLGKGVYLLSGCTFILFILISIMQIKLATFIIIGKLGDPSSIGLASAVLTGGAMVSGFLFGRLFKSFKRYTSVIGSILGAVGYYLFVNASNFNMVMISCFIVGFASIGLLTPYIITRATLVAPQSRTTMAVTWITTASYLGQFFGAYVVQIIENITKSKAPQTSLTFVVYSYIVITIVSFIFITITNRKKNVNLQE